MQYSPMIKLIVGSEKQIWRIIISAMAYIPLARNIIVTSQLSQSITFSLLTGFILIDRVGLHII